MTKVFLSCFRYIKNIQCLVYHRTHWIPNLWQITLASNSTKFISTLFCYLLYFTDAIKIKVEATKKQ